MTEKELISLLNQVGNAHYYEGRCDQAGNRKSAQAWADEAGRLEAALVKRVKTRKQAPYQRREPKNNRWGRSDEH